MDFFGNELARFSTSLEKAGLKKGRVQFDNDYFKNFLYSNLDRSSLKSKGAFFTGASTAQVVVDEIDVSENVQRVFDPTCGAGDLLLAYLSKLNVSSSLYKSLVNYNSYIVGYDIDPAFVECAKLRIIAYALQQGCEWDIESIDAGKSILSNLRCLDSLRCFGWQDDYDIVLMNPPFYCLREYHGDLWGGKRVTAAAAFLEKVIQEANDATRIIAILPDVIRSGSRYEKLRKVVAQNARKISTQILGRFDHIADVDVFKLDMTKGCQDFVNVEDWGKVQSGSELVGGHYTVRVGPVVPHRDPENGKELPFLTSGSCPPWQEIDQPSIVRCYLGTTYRGPFVVIRRTSSPSDKVRFAPTVIVGECEYAVENHLLILKPLDGQLDSCRKLVRLLSLPEATDWINHRIRCRHLTVSALKEMPLDFKGGR